MVTDRTILLLTSGQPASNPRVVKEAIALKDNGYDVTVVYNFWTHWAKKADEQLLNEYPAIKWVCVGGDPVDKKYYFLFTRLRSKIYSIISKIFPQQVFWQQRSIVRCYPELKKAAIKIKADLYIAHNLGALAPAAFASKKNRAKCAFDAEDYHRGETNENTFASKRAVLIENKYFPALSYLSAASPLIAEKYGRLYPALKTVVINNVFSRKSLAKQITVYNKGESLKLFWFSQTVGSDRGLEEAIKAMGIIRDTPVQLTVLGYCSVEMKNYFKKIAQSSGVDFAQIIFLPPVVPEEIFSIANAHHIGLALENAHTPNRNICLTNKIFTYLLSGLAIVASGTDAQKDFLESNDGIGKYYAIGNPVALAEILNQYIQQPELLKEHQQNAWKLAKEKQNWEIESQVFLREVKNATS